MFIPECYSKNARRQRFKQENPPSGIDILIYLDGKKKMFQSYSELSLFQLQSAIFRETPFNSPAIT
jgi:hypothetical protein